MTIQVLLADHTGNRNYEAKLSESAVVGDLLPAIITALELRIIDDAGRQITYHLGHNNRRLRENETLETAGVATGDIITIVPEMTAGLLSLEDTFSQLCTAKAEPCLRLKNTKQTSRNANSGNETGV